MTLTVDPQLAALPRAVQDGILAHPLAGLALYQPRRRRTRVITALGLAAPVTGALLDRPLIWAGAVAATCVLITVTDMIGLRRFAYEADRRAADALGAETMEMALDHLRTGRARPPSAARLANGRVHAVAANAIPTAVPATNVPPWKRWVTNRGSACDTTPRPR